MSSSFPQPADSVHDGTLRISTDPALGYRKTCFSLLHAVWAWYTEHVMALLATAELTQLGLPLFLPHKFAASPVMHALFKLEDVSSIVCRLRPIPPLWDEKIHALYAHRSQSPSFRHFPNGSHLTNHSEQLHGFIPRKWKLLGPCSL